MTFESQILFFFSALGAFNGLFLAFYFAIFNKNRKQSTYFLSALLFVISVRVAKSTFLIFYPEISSAFVEIGLTACLLIGPFLYLYLRASRTEEKKNVRYWYLQVIPVIGLMLVVHFFYPYLEYRRLWWLRSGGILGWLLFSQWLVYMIIAVYENRSIIKRAFHRGEKFSTRDFWMLNVLTGVVLIWVAYYNGYTSYIYGAVSFSFILYISILFWVFRRRQKLNIFFEEPKKYRNKKISKSEAEQISAALESYFTSEHPHRNPSLKIGDVADALDIPVHLLSQFLNDNLNNSFTSYINQFRIKDATKIIKENNLLTLEAIGQDCGFKSNSTFYAAFKKVHGVTPARFKREMN